LLCLWDSLVHLGCLSLLSSWTFIKVWVENLQILSFIIIYKNLDDDNNKEVVNNFWKIQEFKKKKIYAETIHVLCMIH